MTGGVFKVNNIVIFGSGGSIGNALVSLLSATYPQAKVFAVSRSNQTPGPDNVISVCIDYKDETQLTALAHRVTESAAPDLVVVATGVLHDEHLFPEKSFKDISAKQLAHSFEVNTLIPALLIKHFVPHLKRGDRSVFAALSARVGSISDNRLGGWYGYRASKAALNMLLKTAAIEARRLTNPPSSWGYIPAQ